MSKCTPGPWEFNDEGSDCIIGPDGRGISVLAAASANTEWTEGCVPFGDEHDANARLIAATPELLEACKAAESWLGEFVDQSCHDDPNAEGEVRLLQDIRAAIAKAEGRD